MKKALKKILCIRLDNMGDVLMSSPAIRALKESFHCHITLLTSSMAKPICDFIPVIDDVLVYDVPWVKSESTNNADDFFKIVSVLKDGAFDAAVIFTVFSQNPLSAAMLAYFAGIPVRVGYCRENPYELLTHWIVDEEPMTYIRHQVKRDLDLVAAIGGKSSSEDISLQYAPVPFKTLSGKLEKTKFDPGMPWIILHPGVSEEKRQYPTEQWIQAGKK